MSFISLGKIDRDIIPILIGCIFCFFSRLLFTYDETILYEHPILLNIFAESPKTLAIIPLVVAKIRSKKVNKNKVENLTLKEGKFVYTNIKNKIVKGKLIYIILSVVLFFIASCVSSFSISIKTNLYVWNLLITSIFYYFIFKIKLYRHHYLSIITIILTELILDLVSENLQNDFNNSLFNVLLRFLTEILLSLDDIINKYLFENLFVNVYELTLYYGLGLAILFAIFLVFDYYFFKLDNYEEYFNNFNFREMLVIIGVIITQFGLNLSILFTNKNNTPCHIFIIYVFGHLAYYLDFSSHSIVIIICIIFIIFMSLIFNEIIEINFYGLSKNTKRNISFRADSEVSDFGDDISIDVISNKEGYLIEMDDEKTLESNIE